ncbi:ribonuclease R family protein [Gloeocapsa sp. PCC 73106]|uniref:ribonuclease R family protein n=1 Tax=Gloeocapsa sp. PCC 73106 TaxID=102232 RepID=UPI0002ABBD50|nr:ribonuclease R family protein [Gloeocapsa sp. PCC 73106]ELR98697.1 exoribonuclease R [Gloeocapsa sp. PCC 73106]
MEFSIATLLAQFSEDKLVAGKILEKKLDCQNDTIREKLQIALDALEKLGMIVKERGKYRRLYTEELVEAKLRCSSKGFCFAIQDDEDAEDIYVRESHLSNAWNGDRVLVKIIKEGTRRRSPEGEVRLILERANPSLLARVLNENQEYMAIPLDDRLLFELQLQENGTNLAETVDHLVHVNVLRYPIGQYPPLGKITRVLGSDAEAAADTDIVSCKHDLPSDFAPSLLELAANLTKSITATDLENRKDLRDLLTFTLDSDSDHPGIWVENAFTLETTPTGDWQFGIHIVDLPHYLLEESPLDLEARKRGTAIYLGEKILPLFPEAVQNLYSLNVGDEHLTISVLITLDQSGQIQQFTIVPSIIRVDQHLSYQQVQSLLSEEDDIDSSLVNVVEKLRELFFQLSPLVKAQRLERGGFEITLSQTQPPYKDEGRMGVIITDPILPVRSLLTDMIILVGRVVAEHFSALNLPGIFSTQSVPDWDELEDLLKLGVNLGLDMSLESEEEILPQDCQRLTQAFAQSPAQKVLNYLLLSSLKPVKYTSKPGKHFGLAYQDNYTHCVSPGQRYADLWNLRILTALFVHGRDRRHSNAKKAVDLYSNTSHGQINWNVLPPTLQEELENELHHIIHRLNEREKIAEDAEKDLKGLKKAEKMKERTGQVFRGLITGVQSYGFFVEIEDLLVEGLVHVSSLKDDWYEYRSRHSCLIGRKNRIAYRLGDYVEVEVKSVDYYRQQIDLVTVSGGVTATTEDLEDE